MLFRCLFRCRYLETGQSWGIRLASPFPRKIESWISSSLAIPGVSTPYSAFRILAHSDGPTFHLLWLFCSKILVPPWCTLLAGRPCLHCHSSKENDAIKVKLRSRDYSSTNSKHACAEGNVTNLKSVMAKVRIIFYLPTYYPCNIICILYQTFPRGRRVLWAQANMAKNHRKSRKTHTHTHTHTHRHTHTITHTHTYTHTYNLLFPK
jgi:hypothetical protein